MLYVTCYFTFKFVILDADLSHIKLIWQNLRTLVVWIRQFEDFSFNQMEDLIAPAIFFENMRKNKLYMHYECYGFGFIFKHCYFERRLFTPIWLQNFKYLATL